MLSLNHRVAARISQLEAWDDGGDLVLDHQAGAHISSYTGPHAWYSGAGHEPPSVLPVLQYVRAELAAKFDSLDSSRVAATRSTFIEKCSAFDRAPNMTTLIELASVIDQLEPVYVDIVEELPDRIDNDVVEGFGISNVSKMSLRKDGGGR
jgi:hypothetical protein